MNRLLFRLLVILTASFCVAAEPQGQLPPGANVYSTSTVRFPGEPASRKVIFYEIRGSSVGIVVVGHGAREVARSENRVALGLYKGTGLYDLTGDGLPEAVLIAIAGAKTLEGVVYMYQRGRLREIGRWSGQELKVVHLNGQAVVAVRGEHNLTELYVWEGERFVEASDRFPDFFASEIEEQRRLIENPSGLPAYLMAEACQLGARALVYGKKYAEAEELCQKALHVVLSSAALIPSKIGGGAEVLDHDREQAAGQIAGILEQIAKAKEEDVSHLPASWPAAAP